MPQLAERIQGKMDRFTLRTGDLAKVFRKPTRTIRRWVEGGLIPKKFWMRDPYSTRRDYLFDPEAVDVLQDYWIRKSRKN